MKAIKLIAFSLFLTGCAVAPFNTATTARSLGKDKTEVSASVLPTLGLKVERGLGENFDIGAGVELQADTLFFLQGKFAVINNEKNGVSLAGLAGGSLAAGYSRAKSVYAGPVLSYRWDVFELFFGARFNYTRWNYFEFLQKDAGALDDLISLPSTKNHFTYWQFDPGMNFVGEKWSTGLGIHIIQYEKRKFGIPFFNLNYKF